MVSAATENSKMDNMMETANRFMVGHKNKEQTDCLFRAGAYKQETHCKSAGSGFKNEYFMTIANGEK